MPSKRGVMGGGRNRRQSKDGWRNRTENWKRRNLEKFSKSLINFSKCY